MVKTNKYKSSIPASMPVQKKKTVKLDLPWKDMKFEKNTVMLSDKAMGDIAVHVVGDDSWE